MQVKTETKKTAKAAKWIKSGKLFYFRKQPDPKKWQACIIAATISEQQENGKAFAGCEFVSWPGWNGVPWCNKGLLEHFGGDYYKLTAQGFKDFFENPAAQADRVPEVYEAFRQAIRTGNAPKYYRAEMSELML